MRALVHLVRHDVRAQQVPLIVFTALLAFEMGWIVSGDVTVGWRVPAGWIVWIRALFVSLLTGLIIQCDPLVGTTAFWRTRPIGRGLLLMSKLASLGVLLVVGPALALATAWWSTGLRGADAWVAGRVVSTEHAMVVLITAMAAVVTASLTHLVIAGVAGVALVTLINGVLLPAIMTSWPFVGESLFGVTPALYVGTLFVFGLLAVAHQYYTLREWRTAALVALALIAAAVPPRYLTADSQGDAAPVNRALVDPNRVSLAMVPGSERLPHPTTLANPATGRFADYSAALAAGGLPEGVVLRMRRLEGTLTAGDQVVPFSTPRAGYAWVGGSADPARDCVQGAIPEAQLLSVPLADFRRTHLGQIPREAALRLSGQRQTLTAEVTLSALRYRVAASAPLQPGARLTVPGSAFEVLSVTPGSQALISVRVTLVEQLIATVGAPREYVLRNTARKQAVRLRRYGYRARVHGDLGVLRTRFGRATHQLRLGAGDVRYGDTPLSEVLDADWLAGAELIILDVEDLGTFTRPLRAAFTVPDGPDR